MWNGKSITSKLMHWFKVRQPEHQIKQSCEVMQWAHPFSREFWSSVWWVFKGPPCPGAQQSGLDPASSQQMSCEPGQAGWGSYRGQAQKWCQILLPKSHWTISVLWLYYLSRVARKWRQSVSPGGRRKRLDGQHASLHHMYHLISFVSLKVCF